MTPHTPEATTTTGSVTYNPIHDPSYIPPPPPILSKVPYLVAMGAMAALGVIAVLGIMLIRPTQDNTATIGIVLAAIAALTGQILTYLKSDETAKISASTHISVNSQFDQWKRDFGQVAYNKGTADTKLIADIAATAAASAAATVLAALKAELVQQKILNAALAGSSVPALAGAPAPIPVEVKNPESNAVPVEVKVKVE